MRIYRFIVRAALLMALIAPSAFSDREALRQRIDSLDVETQLRKRSGKPIDDLEAEIAKLRDSVVELRSSSPGEGAPAAESDGGSLWESAAAAVSSFLDSAISFKPSGLFDWIIVGTGVVAVLSGLLLFIGLLAGGRRGAAGKKSARPPARTVNLAPQTGRQTAVQDAVPDPLPAKGAAYRYNGMPEINAPQEPQQIPPELETLMQNLRKAAPPPTQPQTEVVPPPPAPPPKAPPQPPSPLIVEGLGSSLPPYARRGAAVSKAGSQGLNDMIVADSKSGLSDVEISRRYQISVDEVRLKLRMKQD
jgi:hypothetical protein